MELKRDTPYNYLSIKEQSINTTKRTRFSRSQSAPLQSHNTNNHRLPKLALPVFNGNALK
jgi:hypothetical protein